MRDVRDTYVSRSAHDDWTDHVRSTCGITLACGLFYGGCFADIELG